MRSITKTCITPAVLAVALALPAAAWAQTTTPAASTAKTATMSSTESATTLSAKVEQRIADMHATLQITKSQEHVWDRFADVMLSNAKAMDTLLADNAGKEATQNAEQILQAYAEITQQHAANVQKLTMSFEKLYTALSPAQKKAADEMFRTTAERHEQKQMQKQGG